MNREQALRGPLRNSPQSLRAQDVLVVLKLHTLADQSWTLAHVATQLGLSASGVHGSIQRLGAARLFNADRREAQGRNVAEFIVHGLKYWLPPVVGAQSQGVPTAASASPLAAEFSGGVTWVWPHISGSAFGQSLVPFHEAVPAAALADSDLHELLALTETLRVGRVRERLRAETLLGLRLGLQ